MLAIITYVLLQCKGCFIKPDGSPGPCAGDVSKCGGCGPPPPALIIDQYVLLLMGIAMFYGFFLIYKQKNRI